MKGLGCSTVTPRQSLMYSHPKTAMVSVDCCILMVDPLPTRPSTFHDSYIVQEWLSVLASVELSECLIGTLSVICGMRSKIQEPFPHLSPRNSATCWTLVSDTLDEVGLSQHYV